jgi:hypothetical protein
MNNDTNEEAFIAFAITQNYDPRLMPAMREGSYTSSSLRTLRDGWDAGMAHAEERQRTKAPTYFTADHAQSMLLRDYFAAQAMQGFLASGRSTADFIREYLPTDAFCLADAMLKARSA